MKFKYAPDHDKLETTCPPKKFKKKNIEAYRWVFDDIENPNNFIPVLFMNPKRFIKKGDIEKCQAMSLSMFDSLENSKKRFNFLKGTIGDKIYKSIGTHIARGNLTTKHGVNSKTDRRGHFSHHPAEGILYSDFFQIIEDL